MRVQKEQFQVQVGAFVAIGILLFMMAIFFLGSKQSVLQRYYRLVCYFDQVSGLRVGAPVHLAGINVGFIESISFEDRVEQGVAEGALPEKEGDRLGAAQKEKKLIVKVKAVMKIDHRYEDRIRSDSIASIQTQGLLGDRMILLTVGSQEGTPLEDGGVIAEVIDPAGFNQLVFESSELIHKAKNFLDNSSGFIQNTNKLVSNVNTIMDEVIDGEGLAHELIYDDQHRETIASLNRILSNFEKVSVDVANVTHKINVGKGTFGALINDDTLYNDLKLLFGKANRNKLVRSVIRYTLQTKDKEHLK
ncbi:MAG: MlaD family protein [bacterium]|nr:MCE family protein [bacterium]MBU1918700.1 MCE family protein [bacterium]